MLHSPKKTVYVKFRDEISSLEIAWLIYLTTWMVQSNTIAKKSDCKALSHCILILYWILYNLLLGNHIMYLTTDYFIDSQQTRCSVLRVTDMYKLKLLKFYYKSLLT